MIFFVCVFFFWGGELERTISTFICLIAIDPIGK